MLDKINININIDMEENYKILDKIISSIIENSSDIKREEIIVTINDDICRTYYLSKLKEI